MGMMIGSDEIVRLVRDGVDVADGVASLLARRQPQRATAAWRKLSAIDIRKDVKELERWYEALLRNEAPPETMNVLWFGLFDALKRGRVVPTLYAAGSDDFDPEDPELEWIGVGEEQSWYPGGRYAQSRFLAALYAAVGEKGFDVALGYGAWVAHHLCRTMPPRLLLGQADWRAVGVGFDDGEALALGFVTKAGHTWQTPAGARRRPGRRRNADELVGVVNIKRQPGVTYAVRNGDLWQTAATGREKRVTHLALDMDPRYEYFLGEDGNIRRRLKAGAKTRPDRARD
jgi:hypothetical protein